MSKAQVFTSKSITEDHPDRVCDYISGSILDAILEQDPKTRVAVEAFITTRLVHVMGGVTIETYVEIPHIVHHEVSQIGYTSSDVGSNGHNCGVVVSPDQQPPDISAGASHSLETRDRQAVDPLEAQDANDQRPTFGYAGNETSNLMPMPIWVTHKFVTRLMKVRKEGIASGLRPDGKAQASAVYKDDVPRALSTVVVSTQHDPDRAQAELRAMVETGVIKLMFNNLGVDVDASGTEILVNPSGNSVVDGPAANSGLARRRLIVNTYGEMARHGGEASSGKDPSKVDRSTSRALRWIAKNIVVVGLVRHCKIQISYAIGQAHPVSLSVETFDTRVMADDRLGKAINAVSGSRPVAIIRSLDLVRPIFRFTTNYGHFGCGEFTWEGTDRVE